MARAGLDRELLVRAAAEIADAEGLESVTLASLAAKLRVRTPSLYNHVQGLPGLRQGLAVFGLTELGERLGKAVMGRSGDDALREAGFAYLLFARTRPGLYEAAMSAPDWEDPAYTAASREVLDILLRVLTYYRLEEHEAYHVVRGFRSLAHGFVALEARQNFRMPLDKDESFGKLLDIFISGLHSTFRQS